MPASAGFPGGRAEPGPAMAEPADPGDDCADACPAASPGPETAAGAGWAEGNWGASWWRAVVMPTIAAAPHSASKAAIATPGQRPVAQKGRLGASVRIGRRLIIPVRRPVVVDDFIRSVPVICRFALCPMSVRTDHLSTPRPRDRSSSLECSE